MPLSCTQATSDTAGGLPGVARLRVLIRLCNSPLACSTYMIGMLFSLSAGHRRRPLFSLTLLPSSRRLRCVSLYDLCECGRESNCHESSTAPLHHVSLCVSGRLHAGQRARVSHDLTTAPTRRMAGNATSPCCREHVAYRGRRVLHMVSALGNKRDKGEQAKMLGRT